MFPSQYCSSLQAGESKYYTRRRKSPQTGEKRVEEVRLYQSFHLIDRASSTPMEPIDNMFAIEGLKGHCSHAKASL